MKQLTEDHKRRMLIERMQGERDKWLAAINISVGHIEETSRFLPSLPILWLNSAVAMAARYDLIKYINADPEHKVWKLKVRVIRLWTVSHFANSRVKAPIEMVVLDEEGDTIQCSIKGIFVPIFEGLLAENNVYVVTNFAVTLNTIKFKPTRHEFRINFKRDTIVRLVQDSSVPLNGFNFILFKKIHAEYKKDGYLVDVIGQLASKGNLVEFTRDGKPSSYITIELDDLESGQKLRVTWWQTLAFNLLKYLEEHPCLTYVVILQMGKIKFYSGAMGVSNINYNSKLFINVEFSAARISLQVYKTIAEIKKHNQDAVFVTAGTIKEVETEFDWWYKGCKKCRRGLRELEKRYFCPIALKTTGSMCQVLNGYDDSMLDVDMEDNFIPSSETLDGMYFLAEIEGIEQKSDSEVEKGLLMLLDSDLPALKVDFLELQNSKWRAYNCVGK
ncbi:Replication factor A protein [Arachis hypogaea]|uniref:Replication factor A protein n=1 Tax=Arachis hypogaea TaxID=3818 RepID=A0A6B9VCJ3_ARAHY|nr:Replication factor A protein [Arachis hypogaea]